MLSICTLTTTVILTSCTKGDVTPTPPTQQQLIEGKWTLKTVINAYNIADSIHRDTITIGFSNFIHFNANGTLSVVDTENRGTDTLTGIWKIENNKMFIDVKEYMNYPNGFDITTLNNTALELFHKDTTSLGILEQKIIYTK